MHYYYYYVYVYVYVLYDSSDFNRRNNPAASLILENSIQKD